MPMSSRSIDSAGSPSPLLVPQDVLLDLPGRGLRQRGEELDLIRCLELGDQLADMSDEVVSVTAAPDLSTTKALGRSPQ